MQLMVLKNIIKFICFTEKETYIFNNVYTLYRLLGTH